MRQNKVFQLLAARYAVCSEKERNFHLEASRTGTFFGCLLVLGFNTYCVPRIAAATKKFIICHLKKLDIY